MKVLFVSGYTESFIFIAAFWTRGAFHAKAFTVETWQRKCAKFWMRSKKPAKCTVTVGEIAKCFNGTVRRAHGTLPQSRKNKNRREHSVSGGNVEIWLHSSVGLTGSIPQSGVSRSCWTPVASLI